MAVTITNAEAQYLTSLLAEQKIKEMQEIDFQIAQLQEKRNQSHVDTIVTSLAQMSPEEVSVQEQVIPNN